MSGKLIILTGFSGSGKDTLMEMVLKNRPQTGRIITHTSRTIRPGEVHGRDYYFVSKSEFETMIETDKLLEYVLYGSDYKGTSKDEFGKVIAGEDIIWRIDMSRAAIVEKTFREKFDPKTAYRLISSTRKIILTVPPEEALKRYQNREAAKANLSEFQKRLKADLKIWEEYKENFPYTVENLSGKINQALREIIGIIES